MNDVLFLLPLEEEQAFLFFLDAELGIEQGLELVLQGDLHEGAGALEGGLAGCELGTNINGGAEGGGIVIDGLAVIDGAREAGEGGGIEFPGENALAVGFLERGLLGGGEGGIVLLGEGGAPEGGAADDGEDLFPAGGIGIEGMGVVIFILRP